MKWMRLLVIAVLLSCGFRAGAEVAAAPEPGSVTVHTAQPGDNFTFSPEQARDPHIRSFLQWTVEDAGTLPRPEAVLALGSSSMRLWKTIENDLAPLEIIHRGFGGSKMHNVLRMMSFFQRYQSQKVMVYEGDNDLSGNNSSVEKYIERCHEFIADIREVTPEAEIYFISTKPSPARVAASERYMEANRQVKAICEADDRLHFIDVYSRMVDETGKPLEDIFSRDRLHMNEKGYEIWTEEVRKAMGLPPLEP